MPDEMRVSHGLLAVRGPRQPGETEAEYQARIAAYEEKVQENERQLLAARAKVKKWLQR